MIKLNFENIEHYSWSIWRNNFWGSQTLHLMLYLGATLKKVWIIMNAACKCYIHYIVIQMCWWTDWARVSCKAFLGMDDSNCWLEGRRARGGGGLGGALACGDHQNPGERNSGSLWAGVNIGVAAFLSQRQYEMGPLWVGALWQIPHGLYTFFYSTFCQIFMFC